MHAIKDMIPPFRLERWELGRVVGGKARRETYMGRERGHGMMIICKNRNSFEVAFMESQ